MKSAATWVPRALAAAILAAVTACSGPAQDGAIEILISDHREAIEDFERLMVEVERVDLHTAGSPTEQGWIELSPQVALVDLTQVVGEASLSILRQPVRAGSYDAVRLVLSGASGALKEGGEVQFGELSQADRIEFEVPGGGLATVVVDLVVQSEDDHPGGEYSIVLIEARQVGER